MHLTAQVAFCRDSYFTSNQQIYFNNYNDDLTFIRNLLLVKNTIRLHNQSFV